MPDIASAGQNPASASPKYKQNVRQSGFQCIPFHVCKPFFPKVASRASYEIQSVHCDAQLRLAGTVSALLLFHYRCCRRLQIANARDLSVSVSKAAAIEMGL